MTLIESDSERSGDSNFLELVRSSQSELPEESGDGVAAKELALDAPKERRILKWRNRSPRNTLQLVFPDGSKHSIGFELADQMRLLLARSDIAPKFGTIAVTAAIAGEGTSYIARSLAGILAHDSSLAICLLEFNWDADERSESVSGIAVHGLDEHGERHDTGQELTLITTGRVAPLERPLFAASDDLADDLEAMRSYFDVIILDVPAVLGHSEVLALCGHAEGYILVAAQGTAPTGHIRSALDDLGRARLAGVVLNKASRNTPKWLTRFMN